MNFKEIFKKIIIIIKSWLGSFIIIQEHEPKDPLIADVHEAKREYMYAIKFFDEVKEKELIDFAIHSMNAAEQRYLYLLKTCQKKGLNNYQIHIY